MYYLTVYNEPIVQPAEPEDLDVEGVLRGIYLLARGRPTAQGPRVAAARLRRRRAVGARGAGAARAGLGRRGRRLERHVLDRAAPRRPGVRRARRSCTREDEPRTPYVTQQLQDAPGPVVAVTDFMRAGAGPDPAVGARATTRRSAPTASASPTPGRPPGGTSTSTARRSRSGRCSCWPAAARSTASAPREAAEKYRLHDVTAGTTGNAGGDSYGGRHSAVGLAGLGLGDLLLQLGRQGGGLCGVRVGQQGGPVPLGLADRPAARAANTISRPTSGLCSAGRQCPVPRDSAASLSPPRAGRADLRAAPDPSGHGRWRWTAVVRRRPGRRRRTAGPARSSGNQARGLWASSSASAHTASSAPVARDSGRVDRRRSGSVTLRRVAAHDLGQLGEGDGVVGVGGELLAQRTLGAAFGLPHPRSPALGEGRLRGRVTVETSAT